MKRRTQKIIPARRSGSILGALPLPGLGVIGLSGVMACLALCLLLLSAVNPQSLTGLRTGTADAFAPVLNIVSVPIQNAAVFVRDVTGLAEIQAENARLTDENIKLREWYQTALLLQAENQSLRELMNLKVEAQNTYITTRVLSDSNTNFVKSLLVSSGANDGVKKGQAVVAGDGLIGRIVEVGERSARVLLLTDMNSRVPVMVEGSRQHAIFSGRNKGHGVLMHLPPETEVKNGSRIVTSGLGGVFPVGLPVGVALNNNTQIAVEPFADFNRLMHVRIVKRPEDPNLRRVIR